MLTELTQNSQYISNVHLFT